MDEKDEELFTARIEEEVELRGDVAKLKERKRNELHVKKEEKWKVEKNPAGESEFMARIVKKITR